MEIIVGGLLLALVVLLIGSIRAIRGTPPAATEDPASDPVANLRRKRLATPEQFVVIDLETTGLDPQRHEIIEIGAILVNRDSDHHTTFQAFVMPNGRITKKITEITGITRMMIAAEGGEPLEAVLPQLIEFIGDRPLVIFNAEFDMGFLSAGLKESGLPPIRNQVTCALKLSRRTWPGLRSYRLTDLAKAGNLKVDGAHRALADCQMTMIVYSAAAQEAVA